MLRHRKEINRADGPHPERLQPSDWNDEHVFGGGSHGAIAMRDTGSADVGMSWVPSAEGILTCAGAGEAPEFRLLEDGDIASLAWSKLTGTPTDLAGYGIATLHVGAAITSDTSPGLCIRKSDPGINLYNDGAVSGERYFQILHSTASGAIELNVLPDDGSTVQTWWSFDLGDMSFNSLSVNTGFLRVTNNYATQSIFGVGGSAGGTSATVFNGSSGNGSGPYLKFQRNGSDVGYVGSDAALRTNDTADMNLTAVGDLWLGAGSARVRVMNAGGVTLLNNSAAHLKWDTDAAGSIGSLGANRPDSAFVKNQIVVGAGGTSTTASANIVVDGASGVGAGPYQVFRRNSVDFAYLGSRTALEGGAATDDFGVYAKGSLWLKAGGAYASAGQFVSVASAVNYLKFTNAAAAAGPLVGVDGPGSDVDLNVVAKGAGAINLNAAVVTVLTRLEFGNASGNVFIGDEAGAAGPTGSAITAVGYQALKDISTSTGYNSAFGLQAMWRTTTGEQNVAVGSYALRFNTTGGSNVAVGHAALATTVSANYNVAVGASALTNMINGQYTVAVGYGAQFYTSTGSSNTSVGQHALFTNTTGSFNLAFGQAALYLNTTGSRNLGLGYDNGTVAASAMTGALTSGSANLGVGQYNYRVAFVLAGAATGLGETLTITTTSGFREVSLSNIPVYAGPLTCTARLIYRSTAGDVNQATWKLLTTIPDNTTTTFVDTVADGLLGAAPTDISNSIYIGHHAFGWKTGQLMFGSDEAPVTEVWIGRSGYSATPDAVTLQPSGASGANVAGANFVIAGSRGTGTAAGGDIVFQTTVAGSSGSAWNALAEVMRLKGANVGIGATAPVSRLSVGGNGSSTSTIYGIASGAATMAVRGDGTGSGTSFGVYGTFSGSAATVGTAVYGINTGATATASYGVQGLASGTNNTSNYGGYFAATGSGATTNYGGRFDASGATTNYGVYSASGRNHFVGSVETESYIEGAEMTAPAAPAANGFRIYAEDNGSGKTRLMALFATGAAQQVAIQP